MTYPLKWKFKRLERVQRILRKINELEADIESLIYLEHQNPALSELFTVCILGEHIKIYSNLRFLFIYFLLFHPKARNVFFFFSVTGKIQARTKMVFFTTEAFCHCSNVSRQVIHSASLKMYIGVFDFFPQRDVLAQGQLMDVKWEFIKGNLTACVRRRSDLQIVMCFPGPDIY